MRPHGLVGEHEQARDVVGRGAAGEQVEDLPLAVGQLASHGPQAHPAGRRRAVVLDELHGQPARDRRLAVDRAAQRARQRGQLHVLRQKARRAGPQAAHPERLVGRAGEEHDADLDVLLVDPARRLDAVHLGHHVVHHHHVGAIEQGQLDGLAARRGLGDDGHVVGLQGVADQAADERVVVGDQRADAWGVFRDVAHVRRYASARRPGRGGAARRHRSGARRSDIRTVERIVRGAWGRVLGRRTARARFAWGFGVGAGFMGATFPAAGWRPLTVPLRPPCD